MTDAGLRPAHEVIAVVEFGRRRNGFVAGERALTLFLDDRDVLTLTTPGIHPGRLPLGYPLGERLMRTVV